MIDVDRLMKRCQTGVGGRNALNDVHDILAECYGALGHQQAEIDRMKAALRAISEAPGGGPGRRIAAQALKERRTCDDHGALRQAERVK